MKRKLIVLLSVLGFAVGVAMASLPCGPILDAACENTCNQDAQEAGYNMGEVLVISTCEITVTPGAYQLASTMMTCSCMVLEPITGPPPPPCSGLGCWPWPFFNPTPVHQMVQHANVYFEIEPLP